MRELEFLDADGKELVKTKRWKIKMREGALMDQGSGGGMCEGMECIEQEEMCLFFLPLL